MSEAFQVKARDLNGNVHDERWTTSRATADEVLEQLRGDPLVQEAWIEPSLHEQRLQAVREHNPAVQDGPYAYIHEDA